MNSAETGESVNFDSEPLLQTEIEGLEYRLDVGMAGTALSVASREPGTWDWSFLGEAKWDGLSLRCKQLERPLREALGRAIRAAADDGE